MKTRMSGFVFCAAGANSLLAHQCSAAGANCGNAMKKASEPRMWRLNLNNESPHAWLHTLLQRIPIICPAGAYASGYKNISQQELHKQLN